MTESTFKMTVRGTFRKLDNLNRIVIPKEIIDRYTKEIGINEKIKGFEVQDTDQNILLLKPIYE